MAVLYLFNPENDLALAAGMANYTPPPVAARLHSAGALLPMWFASEGDYIIAPQSLVQQAERLRHLYGLHGEIFTPADAEKITELRPWGWSADARRQFRVAGADPSLLPSGNDIEQLRQLSHRRTSINILSSLGWDTLPVEATTEEQALEAVQAFGGNAFLRHPWSCSGRGVFETKGLSMSKIREIVRGAIRRQGSVMVEPAYNKLRDFAMLFWCSGGKAVFEGLSCFGTYPGGAYSGNVIAPQIQLRQLVGIEIESLIPQVEAAVSKAIAQTCSGPVGVDMLVAQSPEGKPFVMPCIEANLRYTMGFVAKAVAEHCPALCPASTTDAFLYVN